MEKVKEKSRSPIIHKLLVELENRTGIVVVCANESNVEEALRLIAISRNIDMEKAIVIAADHLQYQNNIGRDIKKLECVISSPQLLSVPKIKEPKPHNNKNLKRYYSRNKW